MTGSRWAVTTAREPSPILLKRAATLAARFSSPLLRRRSFERMAAENDVDVFYIVQQDRELVRGVSGDATFVQPGMLKTKLGRSPKEARHHPLIRAIRGVYREGEPWHENVDVDDGADDIRSLFDGTMGLAGDALHVAGALDTDVVGSEGAPWMHALLEEGIARLRLDPWPDLARAATHVQVPVVASSTLEALTARPDDDVDVVYLDPMMERPMKAAPTFSMVRAIAIADVPPPALWLEAQRVARRRVVLKRPASPHRGLNPEADRGPVVVEGIPLVFGHVVFGTRIDYLVHDVGIDPLNPTLNDDDDEGDDDETVQR